MHGASYASERIVINGVHSEDRSFEKLFGGWMFSRDTVGDAAKRRSNEPCRAHILSTYSTTRSETFTLVYRGGIPPNFVRCDFAAPPFVFGEAAQNTIQLMSAIYSGIDERIIEETFDEIRKGFGNS